MKISALVINKNEDDYLGYCLESLVSCVDEIVIIDSSDSKITESTLAEYATKYPDKIKLFYLPEKDDYSDFRNYGLERCIGEWILWIDGDEVLANKDGNEAKKEDLVKIIEENHEIESFDIFTYHFLYNYFTLDGRQNGVHFSQDRLFIKDNAKFIGRMHEHLTYENKTSLEKRGIVNPVIWHFGGVKNPEQTRKKYAQCMRIFPEGFNTKNPDEYCAGHELLRGFRPTIHYNGKLPKILKLW